VDLPQGVKKERRGGRGELCGRPGFTRSPGRRLGPIIGAVRAPFLRRRPSRTDSSPVLGINSTKLGGDLPPAFDYN
jgi:hypothetical protein